MYIKEAFFTCCKEAQAVASHYVSLYVRTPFYGGPEEGGWWGEDVSLVAYQKCIDREQADAKFEAVQDLVKTLDREARTQFGEQCLREMEWLESRGLDGDYLPEPDGEVSYFVSIEETPGSSESRGCRHYE